MARISEQAAEELVARCKAAGLPEAEFETITGWSFAWAENTTSRKAGLVEDELRKYEYRAGTSTATPKQVDYIISLLRSRDTDLDGSLTGIVDVDGTIDRDALEALSRQAASKLIDQLR